MFEFKGLFRFGIMTLFGRFAQILAFLSMARQLSPEQMGIVAVLTAVYIGFHNLTDFGFDRYIIYSKANSSEEQASTINVVWTLQILRGILVLVSVIPVGLTIRHYLGDQIELQYLIGVAFAIFLLSLANPEISTFERGGDFGNIASIKGLSAFVGAATIIIIVLFWASPWVYVIGQLANTTVFALLSFYYSSGRPTLDFNKQEISRIYAYCKHLLVIAAVSFVSAQFEVFYIGAMFGPALLGMYFTWSRLVQLPREVIAQMHTSIIFAKASDQNRNKLPFNQIHISGFAAIVAIIVPFNCFIWFHGDQVMEFVAGDKWVEYWWAGRQFVLISTAQIMLVTIGPFMLVKNPQVSSRLRSGETLLQVALMILLGNEYGVQGALAAILITLIIATIIRIGMLYHKIVLVKKIQHGVICLALLAIAVGPFLAVEWIYLSNLETIGFVQSAMAYAIVYSAICTIAFIFRRKLVG